MPHLPPFRFPRLHKAHRTFTEYILHIGLDVGREPQVPASKKYKTTREIERVAAAVLSYGPRKETMYAKSWRQVITEGKGR